MGKLTAGGITDLFKDILKLLGDDIRKELADTELMLDIDETRVRDQAYVVKEVTSRSLQQAGSDIESDTREAFNQLLIWFKKNPETAKKLFSELYRSKHRLYDEEVIAENIEKAEQLSDLLDDFGASDISQLRTLLDQKTDNGGLLPVTQEIISSMGITSIDEWKEALEDKDLAALFDHESTPSTDMFVYAQSLIDKARNNIIAQLKELGDYDVSEVDLDTAPTIIAGVIKNGAEISIVTRPAYNEEVIIYYGSEKDMLDYEDAELWVDTGDECKRITLGHILKKAEIKKFPI